MSARARIGLVGLSGYAAELCGLLLAGGEHEEGRIELAACFAIDADDHPERFAEFGRRGVRCHRSFEDLIGDESLDAVWLPVPIHLHRSLGTGVLRAGRALILEKPVAGSVADHLAIAQASGEAGRPVCIGFQDVYSPTTARLKEQLLSGALGAPTAASVSGAWPRAANYFTRNAAAGWLEVDGVPVRDSPLANAMAHFVNLALFLLGVEPNSAAMPVAVSAQCARAHDIESFDTCSIRATLEQPALDLVVNLSHATSEPIEPTVEIDTDRGSLRWCYGGGSTFREHNSGRVETLTAPTPPRPHMVRTIGELLLGREPSLHFADLGNALPHTTLVEMVHQSGGITTIAGERIEQPDRRVTEPLNVPGLRDAISKAAEARTTLADAGFDLAALGA
ncbi:MAG: Gfo/Idh/MocA family oxidoreductase [Phycisphaeraceae bacterium]|nr:MAG: Gfo/Idh/MocA family oxidoreductase [Phycisphaeraceae bacterium]